jgi:hypothetical protein
MVDSRRLPPPALAPPAAVPPLSFGPAPRVRRVWSAFGGAHTIVQLPAPAALNGGFAARCASNFPL